VLVVGHSLGGLVALRLALDAPRLVSGLLLLDPSPLLPAVLLPAGALRVARLHRRRAGSLSAPRAVSPFVRVMWHFVLDAVPLAADLAGRPPTGIPTTIVSAGAHARDSAMRRTHDRLATSIPGAGFEVWEGTTHSLDGEEPRIADAALALASPHA
jgi:pimeloyl-ACP methyl ester carboxylesterase